MDPQASRALRSVLVVIICTTVAMASTSGGFYPPRNHPFVYALAMSWLIVARGRLRRRGRLHAFNVARVYRLTGRSLSLAWLDTLMAQQSS